MVVGTQNKAYRNESISDLYAWLSHNVLSNIGLRKTELTGEIGISAFHEGNCMCEVIFGRVFNFQQRFKKTRRLVLSEKLVIVRLQTEVYVHEIILDLYAWSSQNALTKMKPQDMHAECQISVSAFQEGKQVRGWKIRFYFFLETQPIRLVLKA